MIIAAIVMFASILVETGLYITKSYKSDLITQKVQRQQKVSQQQSFDKYYAKLQSSKPTVSAKFERSATDDGQHAKNRRENPEHAKQTTDSKEQLSKKEK